ncbi:kumamolisin [Edaphobacter acidisoli]|uniref:Kumamolisin n=1 Tax=Edaphobacter acidisoli TaxID=2040573 RepID=A0A916RQR4_9BACT|nr:S53 family peptidase [Edaphobacter acidisoli]GGA64725.1 kumamolisin [Edaphobacter acidisoli]
MATRKSTPRAISQPRIVLPGSEKAPLTNQPAEVPLSPGKKITVSIIVKCRQQLKVANFLGAKRLTRAKFRQQYGADSGTVKLIRSFAKEYGLTISPDTPAPECRTVKLTGTVANFERAFGVTLTHRSFQGNTYRVREGSITLPAELAGHVEAVLGLDNRPQAEPHFRIAGERGNAAARAAQGTGFATPHALPAASASTSYTPPQIAQLYQFPANATAKGQTIGIIELGGGYRTTDLASYFKSLGQTTPKVTAVSVDGGKNSPSNANSADGEVMLDIEVAAAVAPGANIAVYFAPNTDQGFVDAVTTAVHDSANNPSVISISWGSAEANWTQQAMTALDSACQAAAALGITITVAAGDNGSTDGGTGNNVDFPASSPHVLGCGGTKLEGNGSTISSEVVWNELSSNEGATGGGVSNVFALPTWQTGANVPKPTTSAGGRGVPDVAGNADPSTGYNVLVDGQSLVIGGTSAVAPLWAGLIAVANAQNGKSAGFLQPQIYKANSQSAFRDVTSGNNGAFSAGPGWDACTGLGSPIANRLIAAVAPSKASKPGRQTKTSGKSARPA